MYSILFYFIHSRSSGPRRAWTNASVDVRPTTSDERSADEGNQPPERASAPAALRD